jgi:hypothetical protein
MTLTVQDLVTRFDDFADDANVRIKIHYSDEFKYFFRDVASIEKDDKGNVVLIAETFPPRDDDHEESDDEDDEDEGEE